ncbi:MAG TPA: carbon storage regulator [Dehalococcoidia bacterium]|nr:carbon storage regulator [Dehalococcoidia bacterium]
MLILVRKVQQGIWIEGDIFVKVLSVERDRVKLGIEAPSDIKVMRQELFDEVMNPGVPDDEPTVAGAVEQLPDAS